ncbi:MAG: hypothetical protein JJ895_05150 [Balneolaceae bacterium]|nr:hypothetical protein [Balneolaceae bacterium]
MLNKSKLETNIAVVYIALFALGDYNRLQPWLFYYLVFVGIIVNRSDSQKSIHSIALILCFLYVMSGLQKANGGFAYTTHPWLLAPITNLVDSETKDILNSLFWIGPAIEFIAGIGLIFKKTSRICALILIAMHVFILLMIGPLGRNTNVVVWPWNIAFILILYLIFVKFKPDLLGFIIDSKNVRHTSMVFLAFLILPMLSFWNLWPKHFSAALYSGNKIRSEILIPDELAEQLKLITPVPSNGLEFVLVPNAWSLNELKVPLYPSKTAHLLLYQQLCKQYSEYADYFVFTLKPMIDIKSGERASIHYFCSDFE